MGYKAITDVLGLPVTLSEDFVNAAVLMAMLQLFKKI